MNNNEARETYAQLLSHMTPEYFNEFMKNTRYLAAQSGRDNEREELVCRLLASGMPVDEIAVVLCLRADAVRIIESNNAAIMIPEYAKKLKERRKRRNKQRVGL